MIIQAVIRDYTIFIISNIFQQNQNVLSHFLNFTHIYEKLDMCTYS